MVNLKPPVTAASALRPMRSSVKKAYYDALKESGKLKSDIPVRNKTVSYDKHFLRHTDTTGGGGGHSYPHNKDFAWNLLFLKQSWGANLNSTGTRKSPSENSLKFSPISSTSRAKSRSKSQSEKPPSTSQHGAVSKVKKPFTASDLVLPPLHTKTPSQFNSTASAYKDRKRRSACSDKSRITLDSIPENETLNTSMKSPQSKTTSKRRFVGSSLSDGSSSSYGGRISRRSESKSSRLTTSSSLMSSRLPSVASDGRNGAMTSSTGSYNSASRMSSAASGATRWDEHEGRPAAEKRIFKSGLQAYKPKPVENTIKPEVLKTLVRAVSEELNTRRRESKHLDSSAVASNFGDSFSMRRHQPFTNLKFAVENSASTARLRSSLYKSEKSQSKPSIFRSNLIEVQNQKSFNPLYHGEITRPVMVDAHAHKHGLEGFAKWAPKVSGINVNKGPWTTYETR